MIFDRKRKSLDDFIVLFDNKFSSMSKYSSNNILAFKFFSDEVSESVDFNAAMGINFSDIGDFPSRNRQFKIPFSINICSKTKSFRNVSEGSPEIVSEYSGESCIVFFLGESSVRFLVIVVIKKAFVDSPEEDNCRTIMPGEHSVLPEGIKALNRGISAWLSLRDEDQMNPKEKMKPNNPGYAVFISASACSCHLVIHLRDHGNSHELPCINKMPAQRKRLFIVELTRKSRMSCHINSVERIKTRNSFGAPEISRTNKVCLVEVSHLLCLGIWVRLIIAVPFRLGFACFPMFREHIGNSGDRGNIFDLSVLKLPVNDFRTNSREGRSTSPVRLQFFSCGEYLFNHTLWSLPPYPLRCTASVFKTINPFFFKSVKPFSKPTLAPLNQPEYFAESAPLIIKLYCFATFFIFLILFIHRFYSFQIFLEGV